MIASSFADFSLSELVRLLCFENEEQAVAFLRAYSLKVSDSGQVRRMALRVLCVGGGGAYIRSILLFLLFPPVRRGRKADRKPGVRELPPTSTVLRHPAGVDRCS